MRSNIQFFNPFFITRNLWCHRELIYQLAKRDTIVKYKGSMLGVLWSFITPIIMLAIYTFVFGVIFQAKWGKTEENLFSFGLTLFAGLIIYSIFAEVLNRSTSIILSHPNYVKKVVFPLEIFPVVLVITALVNALISTVILFVIYSIVNSTIHWTIVFLPIILLPISLLSLGLGWILAAIGVFVRDIGNVIGLFVQMMMFLSPVFYPVSVVPKAFQPFFYINPIGIVIEELRQVVLWGEIPQWNQWVIVTLISFAICLIGHYIFQCCKGAFADVI